MFWAFKLSFDVDILVFLVHFLQKLGEILFSFLVTLLLLFTNMTKIFSFSILIRTSHIICDHDNDA